MYGIPEQFLVRARKWAFPRRGPFFFSTSVGKGWVNKQFEEQIQTSIQTEILWVEAEVEVDQDLLEVRVKYMKVSRSV